MRNIFRLVFVLCSILPLTVRAFDFNNCQVEEVVVAGVNNAHVRLSCTVEPRPACAVAGNYVGFDKSTAEGKQYLATMLTAFASNSKVTGFVNDGVCSTYQGNVALLEHLRLRK